jgi:hypothetical protein
MNFFIDIIWGFALGFTIEDFEEFKVLIVHLGPVQLIWTNE